MNRVIKFLGITIFLIIIWNCESTDKIKQVEIIKLKPFKSVSAINDTIFFSRISQIIEYKNLLYLTDFKSNRVLCIDSNLNHKYTIGRIGSGPGEFREPIGIAISDDVVYVADRGNMRISAFSLNGKFITSFKVNFLCNRITIDTTKLISFFSMPDATTVLSKYDINGNIMNRSEVETQPGIFPVSGFFDRINSYLFTDPLTNHMYCVSRYNPFIEKYSESGKLINRFDLSKLPSFKDRIFNVLKRYKKSINNYKDHPKGFGGGIVFFNGACMYKNLIYVSYLDKILVFDTTNDKMELVRIIEQFVDDTYKKGFSTICVYDNYLINESRGEIQIFKLK